MRARCHAGTLAHIHSLDPAALGLASFGKAAGFCARQVATWSKQYMQSTEPGSGNERLPVMAQLTAWLQAHAPAADAAAGPPCIVHGDFRLDNLIVHAQQLEISAVLDWELATLGNPLSDLAYNCMVRAARAALALCLLRRRTCRPRHRAVCCVRLRAAALVRGACWGDVSSFTARQARPCSWQAYAYMESTLARRTVITCNF